MISVSLSAGRLPSTVLDGDRSAQCRVGASQSVFIIGLSAVLCAAERISHTRHGRALVSHSGWWTPYRVRAHAPFVGYSGTGNRAAAPFGHALGVLAPFESVQPGVLSAPEERNGLQPRWIRYFSTAKKDGGSWSLSANVPNPRSTKPSAPPPATDSACLKNGRNPIPKSKSCGRASAPISGLWGRKEATTSAGRRAAFLRTASRNL